MTSNFNYRTERVASGYNVHFIDQPPANCTAKATLFCIHGFPDFSFGWRHQVNAWSNAGFRVIVPDTLGCGGSDKPQETSAYSVNAIVIGHDWGAMIAWRFLQWYPERVLALATLSIPYYPPPLQYISLEEAARRVPNFGYQVYFGAPESTAEIEANIHRFFATVYRQPESRGSISRLGEIRNVLLGNAVVEVKPLLNENEMATYVSAFKQGMHGPLSYYRNGRLNFQDCSSLPAKLPEHTPILFMYGTEDFASSAHAAQSSMRFAPHMIIVRMEGRGHWLMLEARDEVTERIITFANHALGVKSKL